MNNNLFSGLPDLLRRGLPVRRDDTEEEDDLTVYEVSASEENPSPRRFLFGLSSIEDPVTRYLIGMLLFTVLAALIGFLVYNRTHRFDEYRILKSAQEHDVEGTEYALLGKHIIKYSHDGVFCVNFSNEMDWSAAWSMQTPIARICGSVMAVAEQQGTQVYLLNEKGLLGQFEAALPIMKLKVTASGEVLLVLKDSDVTWINLYSRDGTQIASIKTTVADSGYPLDAALSANGKRVLVSYANVAQGDLRGKLTVYDFSSGASSEDSHVGGTLEFENSVFPEVYYADGSVPVAVGDDLFVVLTESRTPRVKARVDFSKEIISSFHDESYIGFVTRSDDPSQKYEMEVYNYRGKNAMHSSFRFDYSTIAVDGEEILMYDARTLNGYRTSGREKLEMAYEKEVRFFAALPGFRKYLVITEDSMDQIRLK